MSPAAERRQPVHGRADRAGVAACSPQSFGDLNDPLAGRRADPPARGRPAWACPTGPEVAREWLKQTFGAAHDREIVRGDPQPVQQPGQRRADPQRHRQPGPARATSGSLLGSPVVTPLDVFQAYRDQNERVSVRAVELPRRGLLAKVPEPVAVGGPRRTTIDIQDVLPDPARATPGFKIPRQIRVEILSIDGNALARGIKDKLTEAELRQPITRTASRSSNNLRNSPARSSPRTQPELTPPLGTSRSPRSGPTWPPRSPRRRPRPRSSSKFEQDQGRGDHPLRRQVSRRRRRDQRGQEGGEDPKGDPAEIRAPEASGASGRASSTTILRS